MKKWTKAGLSVMAALAIGLTGAVGASGSAPQPPGNGTTGPSESANAAPAGSLLADIPHRYEDLYVPLAPCRIVDTRLAGGTIAAGASRSFYVRGTQQFVTQGGQSGGCGVPNSATSVSIILHEASTQGAGYSHLYPTGGSIPNASFISYVQNEFRDNGGDVSLGGVGAVKNLVVDAVRNNASVVIEVTGYYTPQIYAVLMYNGTTTFPDGIYRDGFGNRFATPRVISSRLTSPGAYEVTLDRDVSGCSPIASVYGGPFVASSTISGNHVYAYMYTLQATTNSPTGTPTNLYWSLHVMC